jgi:uncharacterized protein
VIDLELLKTEAARHPYPLMFATVSGAHLYGFPSSDSDYDIRGVHVLPANESLGLLPKRETVEVEGMRGGVELDLMTHDVLKFFSLLLKKNGYVLEQLYSPLVIQSSPAHDELKQIAKSCVTRHHSHHYLGFAATQWNLFQKESPPRVKPLLYVYRVLLTGIHLMRTGRIEANLIALNEDFRLPYLAELVRRKSEGAEESKLETPEIEFHQAEYRRLVAQLQTEAVGSELPDKAACGDALNDLLIRVGLPE